jgi:hypothetical protein
MPNHKNKKIDLSDSEPDDIIEEYDSEFDDNEADGSDNESDKDEYANDDIRNIIFKDIDDKYAYGKLGNFKVMLMKKNGYINATKLCKDATNLCKDAKKDFFHWKENKNAKELITELKSSLGIPRELLILKIMKGDYITRGTYVHPQLIIHIASWCSPKYALQVSNIVIKYHAKQAIEEKDRLLQKKDDKIDKLSTKINKQSGKIDTLLKENSNQSGKIDTLLKENGTQMKKIGKMDNRIKRLVKKNDEIYDQNEEISGKIDVISNDRVVAGRKNDDHMLIIIKNNDNPDEYDDDEDIYEYNALRVMKKSYKNRLIDHKERHPEMEIIMKINYSPNAMNLWNRVKTKLGRNKIIVSGCKFNLEDKYSENKLIRDIKNIHNERLNVDDI